MILAEAASGLRCISFSHSLSSNGCWGLARLRKRLAFQGRGKGPACLVCVAMYGQYDSAKTSSERTWHLPQNLELPPELPKKKKKPFVTPIQTLIKRKKRNRLFPRPVVAPADGMLVKALVPTAHNVMQARETVLQGVVRIMKDFPVKICSYCEEVFVGSEGHRLRSCRGPGCSQRKGHHHWIDAELEDVIPPVECYHVYDRLGPPIRHVQRFEIPRIPAVVELCIQAGVDIPEYPAVRRSSPMVVQECATELAFESQATEMKEANTGAPTCIDGNGAEYYNLEDNGLVDGSSLMGQESCDAKDDTLEIAESETHLESTSMGDLFKCSGNLVEDEDSVDTSPLDEPKETSCDKIDEVKATAIRTIKAWHAMRMGVKKLMKRYPVRACGYCPEVQVGPRGHKAQLCGAFKHQWRNGQHGWQEATLDEVVPRKFVWHVRDGAPLVNELRKYYGQAPAVVELCMKAGAEVPGLWKPFMRLHVAIPAGCLIAHLDAT